MEVIVRVNSDSFYALSDKLLLKVELLKRNPDTRVLCLGTSRFLDAIDERLFTAQIERLTGESIKVMNGATTGFQGARFAYIAEIAAKNPNLTHVILEATPPALHDGDLKIPGQIGDREIPDGSGEKFATRVENRLQHWVTQHLALAKYRKALRPATFEKFVVLHTSKFIAPNAWSRKGSLRNLRNLFVSGEVEITDEMTSALQPEIIIGKSLESPQGRRSADQMYQHLNHISEIFADSGIQVIWVAPPVSRDSIDKNHSAKYSEWMADFIRVVRKDLVVPKMPFVIGATGVSGGDHPSGLLESRMVGDQDVSR